jgi:hypothetical protein
MQALRIGDRAAKARVAALVVVGVVATVLVSAGSSRAAAPSVFASASGTCTPATGSSNFMTTPITGAHPDVLMRVTTQAGPGSVIGSETDTGEPLLIFGGADTAWTEYDASLSNGDLATGELGCSSAPSDVAYTVDFLDPPLTPTLFAGSSTYSPDFGDTPMQAGNGLAFVAPATAHYVADLSLTQGAMTVDDRKRSQIFASSGRFDLGILAGGIQRVHLTPQDGPQAKWTLSISALPVALSNLAFDRQYERPTQITTANYALDGDVTLTATILNSAQQAVRSLAANISVSAGSHSLTWDGLDGSGSPVADGSYTLAISYTDAAGNSGGGQASIVVDGTPPSASVVSPSSLPRTHGLVIQVADNLSGLKSASLSVDGAKVQTLGPGQAQFTYIPSGSWRYGAHSFSVSATDNAGNVASNGGRFTVPAPPARVYTPNCVGKPRFKPRSIILACADDGLLVTKIHWTRWTRQIATGVGVYNWNDCKPSCVAGHFHARAGARLKLYSVARCRSKGFLEFTHLRLTPPRSLRARPSTWSLSCRRR